jgi:hypothetical protein
VASTLLALKNAVLKPKDDVSNTRSGHFTPSRLSVEGFRCLAYKPRPFWQLSFLRYNLRIGLSPVNRGKPYNPTRRKIGRV